jgi:chromosome partitioning protein
VTKGGSDGVTATQSESTGTGPTVVTGLGWPGSVGRPESGLGWPGDSSSPAEQVSRETGIAADEVSDVAGSRAGAPRGDDVPNPTEASPTSVPRETGATDVASPSVPTAGALAQGNGWQDDRTTPLAASVEHTLLVREGRRLTDPMPRPARTRVMAVANQKGGVGKTTTAVNLAASLAQGGLRVLVVDLDPQGNASTALAVDHHRGTLSTYDALVEGRPLVDVVAASPEIEGLFVVPSTIDLAGAEIELVSMVAREGRLRRAIHAHPWVFGEAEDRFDFVLVDCPPSLGLLTLNALVAADEVLIPIQAEYYALEGLGQLLETVEMVKAHLNPDLDVSTIVLTMYDARTRLAAGVADEVRAHFADRVLRTAIPRSVRISEAPSYGQTVMTYDPGSPGALSYFEAARELAGRTPSSVPVTTTTGASG